MKTRTILDLGLDDDIFEDDLDKERNGKLDYLLTVVNIVDCV